MNPCASNSNQLVLFLFVLMMVCVAAACYRVSTTSGRHLSYSPILAAPAPSSNVLLLLRSIPNYARSLWLAGLVAII